MALDVAVVGAGVSGLTCAVRLLEAGYTVRVVAAEFATDPPRHPEGDDREAGYPPPMCSPFAAAMWYPFAVEPLDRAAGWAKASLAHYRTLEQHKEWGVSLVPFSLFFGKEPDAIVASLMAECSPHPIPVPSAEYTVGIRVEAPFIETRVFLPYLESCVRERGGTVERRTLDSLEAVRALASVVVNCTGLGAGALCEDDAVEPIRGQVLRVAAPAVNAYSLALPDGGNPIYVIPRSADCVLGGTEEHGERRTRPDARMLRTIEEWCRWLEPDLGEGYEIVAEKAGLRPGRNEVRLEPEVFDDCTVVHNYGHGGAGFTVAWGCADEVVRHVKDAFQARADGTTAPD
ncbi:FAD-dependent oxidoreductase [Longimicrobium sp.]|uniref:FAD-dependent oxidoreductase n=1 Tax=Longimicrobium sp. TaxID=2029185 RepID=UPI003B3AF46A